MIYDFDQEVNRVNSDCQKYDNRELIFGKSDLIPMWVADTDFKTPSFVVDAVKERASHEVYGYPLKPDSYFESIVGWYKRRHSWHIEKDWIQFCPNVVSGIASLVLSLTSRGDKIIVQPPVYFPFFHVIEGNGRLVLENPLKREGDRYFFDFEQLKSLIDNDTKMLLLCSPHNPGGMVWTKEELNELGQICAEKNIIVISDEIHADLVFREYEHTPFPAVTDAFQQNSIVVSSASKTFNMAGLSSAFIITANSKFRKAYEGFMKATHIASGNFFGITATQAAFTHGDAWLDELVVYIEQNFHYIDDFIKEKIPGLRIIKPEATFLLWIDFSGLPLSATQIYKKLIDNGLGLSPGHLFGKGGENFLRLNMGCPLKIVKQAMELLKKTIDEIGAD